MAATSRHCHVRRRIGISPSLLLGCRPLPLSHVEFLLPYVEATAQVFTCGLAFRPSVAAACISVSCWPHARLARKQTCFHVHFPGTPGQCALRVLSFAPFLTDKVSRSCSMRLHMRAGSAFNSIAIALSPLHGWHPVWPLSILCHSLRYLRKPTRRRPGRTLGNGMSLRSQSVAFVGEYLHTLPCIIIPAGFPTASPSLLSSLLVLVAARLCLAASHW